MSTFWRYVRIQVMVFVFGIVGPIFLIVYFAAQPDPTLKWMYFVGLILTGAEVLIALELTRRSTPSDTTVELLE
ncbi:hypothetical protein B7435_27900 [Mycolicibacterium peregrinum]|jgi:ABC-type multidrug transport system permease subunit|uniref:Uncharacterized protein n=1 Tax=Mycolicibacterium peregrinum TaxID=43304 RepID=A0A1A1Z737_MYCPR|nr:hypothetical protein [Mycolicibacterium peregrinum]MCV7206865.1 hypothetical protein [Mycolicibacterium peregrinum]OBB95081.1 hypothetical protein A5779_18960 [Mycolicibacterium peregrinum]OBF39383.1 hypothetical protein A5719_17270 [Mycolicibacterium peregrinum]ORW55297.1 hypothetical protein AWC21_21540 [Mycolicibacterium peregrinum]OWL96671.1 hypothetical protein B7435_27900 [Mycolicibacterium peregrinum]